MPLPLWIDRILSHKSMRNSFFETLDALGADATTDMCQSVSDGDLGAAQVAEGRRQAFEQLRRQVEMEEREEQAQEARKQKGGKR